MCFSMSSCDLRSFCRGSVISSVWGRGGDVFSPLGVLLWDPLRCILSTLRMPSPDRRDRTIAPPSLCSAEFVSFLEWSPAAVEEWTTSFGSWTDDREAPRKSKMASISDRRRVSTVCMSLNLAGIGEALSAPVILTLTYIGATTDNYSKGIVVYFFSRPLSLFPPLPLHLSLVIDQLS